MRIAFITYEYPPDTGKGGIGTYTRQVAAMLANVGWDVHVFCATANSDSLVVEEGIQVHKLHATNPQQFTQLVQPYFLKQHQQKKFQLLEVPEIHGHAIDIKKQLPQLPLLVRLHAPNWLVEHTKKKYLPLHKKLRYVLGALRRLKWDAGYWKPYDKYADPDYQQARLADKIVAPSAIMKNWAVTHWHLDSRSTEVLPNIFEPSDAFLQIPIAEKEEHKTILFFGRLNVLKGLVNASLAMKKILQKYPDWKWIIIGDDGPGPSGTGSMRQWMQQHIKPVQANVHFKNGLAYEDLPAEISKATIVLLPSLFESFSYTCLEAMAAGKAVIGSRGTGMETIMSNGQDGLLVDPLKVNEITRAIERLIQHPALRLQLARQARVTASEKFCTSKLLLPYQQLYQSGIANS